MRFRESGLAGGWVIEPEPIGDERGWFARAFCAEEFRAHGLPGRFPQTNMSESRRAGTIRGLHVQLPPHAEAKALRCVAGRVFDVAVDLRPDSPTFLRWSGVELDADGAAMVYVPGGCAHAYQALEDRSRVLYMVSEPYTPGSETGVRWDDPALGIDWPVTEPVIVSDKDGSWPDLDVEVWRGEWQRALERGETAP